MRGSQSLRALVRPRGRSIPTCAGQPHSASSCARRRQVYPHVCGAATGKSMQECKAEGLSPRVRGSRNGVSLIATNEGSIPTCAGQPSMLFAPASASWVYPHVCGAAISDTQSHVTSRGLSPRVRGSRAAQVPRNTHWRSIPTCAGQPCCPSGSQPAHGVYPHVCGAA